MIPMLLFLLKAPFHLSSRTCIVELTTEILPCNAPINDKPHPPHLGRGGGYVWDTICVPWWGKVQLTPIDCLGVKVNMWHGFNQDSTIHCKKNLPGVGVGEWWGKGHCCNAPWGGGGGGGGGRSLVNGQFPHPAPGGGGLSLIGA